MNEQHNNIYLNISFPFQIILFFNMLNAFYRNIIQAIKGQLCEKKNSPLDRHIMFRSKNCHKRFFADVKRYILIQ